MASKALMGFVNPSKGVGRFLIYGGGSWPYHFAFETNLSYVSHLPDLSRKTTEAHPERVYVSDAPDKYKNQIVASRPSFFRLRREDFLKYGPPTEGILIPNLDVEKIMKDFSMRMSIDRRPLQPWEVETRGGVEQNAVRIVCGTCEYRLAGGAADNCITTALMLMAAGLPPKLRPLIYSTKTLHDFSNTQITDLRLKLLEQIGKPLGMIEDASLETPIEKIEVEGTDKPEE